MDYRTFLLNNYALVCVSKLRYDTNAQEYKLLLHCAESLRCNNIVFINCRRTSCTILTS